MPVQAPMEMGEGKTVAKVVAETLRELGVRHVFGVPSGGWVDYMEALRTTPGIEFVLTTEEGSGGMMADVCGRLSGAPGVCFGTFGPGATNLATGVGEALLDRSPMIALTDEMPLALRGRTTQMGIDHQALFRPLTKWTTRLSADAVRATLIEAARIALSGRRGPVHVGLPVGLSAERVAAGMANQVADGASELPAAVPEPAAIEEAVRRLRSSKKPLLAVGLGAVRAGLHAQVKALAERHRLPVVLTPMAKGVLPESHECYVGVLFHALSDMVGETHREADLVIAVGYDPVEFNYESWLAPTAALVSIDDEYPDIDEGQYHVASAVVGGAGGAMAGALAALAAAPPVRHDWDFAAIHARRARMFARLAPAAGVFGPRAALAILRELLPDSGIMTCDVGAHTHLIGQLWKTPQVNRQIMTNGWSAMGFGIPAAIGAKLSCPDNEVCAVLGDGGFLMTAGELATAARLGLKIVFVLLTDNDLALIRIKQQKKGNPVYGTVVREQGTIGGDNLFGVPVSTASTPAGFRVALGAAFAGTGPAIVEAIVDSREYDEVVLKKDRG